MKFVSKPILLPIALAAAVLGGCSKKPVRPDPSATIMGQQGGGPGALAPTEVPTTADVNSTLTPRDGIIEDANTIRGLLQPVYFDFNLSFIKPSERSKLQAAKDYLDKNPQYRLLIEAHCDWRGTAEYNLALGDRRATTARKYLTTLGVPADRIETVSKGSEEAVKTGDDSSWAKDRRDDLVVLKK